MSRGRHSRPHSFRRTASVGALVLFTSVLVPTLPGGTAHAAAPPAPPKAGALDVSFGGDGGAVIDGEPGAEFPQYTAASRVLLADDGSINVMAGGGPAAGILGAVTAAGLPQYADPTTTTRPIAATSTATLPFRASGGSNAFVRDAASGAFYVGGALTNGDNISRVAVQRYTVTHELDTTWTGGTFDTGLPGYAVALALQPDGKLLVAAANDGGGWQLARLLADGSALDVGFNTRQDIELGTVGGSTTAQPGTGGAPTDIGLDDRGRIYVYGDATVPERNNDGVSVQVHRLVVARYLGDGSALDTDSRTGYGQEPLGGPFLVGGTGGGGGPAPDQPRPGFARIAGSKSSAMVVEPDGTATVVGDRTVSFGIEGTTSRALVRRFNPAGENDAAFAGGKDIDFDADAYGSSALGVALDENRAAVVAGSSQSPGSDPSYMALARVTASGDLDPEFGNGGVEEISTDFLGNESSCYNARLSGVTVQPDGRIVAAGECEGSVVVVRVIGRPAVTGLTLTTNVPAIAASPQRVPTADIPQASIDEAMAELQSSPLRYSPLRYSPLRYSPLRYSPLRYSPLRYSPLNLEALGAVTLAQIPLTSPLDWDVILRDTPYENAPLQSVLVSDLLALEVGQITQAKFNEISALNLDQFDITNTYLRDSELAAFLLGSTPVANLAGASDSYDAWCVAVNLDATNHAQPPPCDPNAPDAAVGPMSLLELQQAGADLDAYYALRRSLARSVLVDAPLAQMRLTDIELSYTQVGDLPVSSLDSPSAICSTSCGGTLSESHARGGLVATATVADLLSRLNVSATSRAASAGDWLTGLIGPQDIPYEALNLDDVLYHLPIPDAGLVTYRAAFSADCSAADGLSVEIDLPSFRIKSVEFTINGRTKSAAQPDFGGGGDVVVVNPDLEIARGDYTPPGGTFSYSARPAGGLNCTGIAAVAMNVTVEPPNVLGKPVSAARVVIPNVGTLGTGPQTPVTFTDPVDLGKDVTVPGARDELTLGYLAREGAADYYTLDLAPGETAEITLSHLPADYDLVVYDDLPLDANGAAGALGSTPLRYSPLRYSPLRYSPTDDTVPGADQMEANPENITGIPLLQKRIRAASVARGQNVEAVQVTMRDGEPGRLTIGVVPFNGAQSNESYVLHTDVDAPATPPACIPARILPKTGTVGTLPSRLNADTESIILVNRKRMSQLYGTTNGAIEGTSGLISQATAFAARTDVKGQVIDVGADPAVAKAYTAWDADPCSIVKINAVVTAINALIDRLRGSAPELRFLTILGNDDAIPMGRVPDLTDEANQSDYAPATRVGSKDNPVSRSFFKKYLLSDDPYGALAPSAFLDSQLFVPDIAVGRLVETPAEITASLTEFITKNGMRNAQTYYTAAYDFLKDLGLDIKATADARTGSSTPANLTEDWTKANAEEGLLANKNGISSINAHFDNNRALPALANAQGVEVAGSLLSSNGSLPDTLSDGILFTVGCNAGVNLSDLLSKTVSGTTDKEKARMADWAQRISAKQGVFVANTGFGYGDTQAIAYSERLMSYFAKNLDGSMTVGQALQFAKQKYLGLGVAGVYDHKSLTESTFYGLPQWRLKKADGTAGAAVKTALPRTGSFSSFPVYDVLPKSYTPTTLRVTGLRGDYFTAGLTSTTQQQPQVTAYRPIEPRFEDALPVRNDDLALHGVTVEALTTHEEAIDPAVAIPIVDLSDYRPEPDVTTAYYPTSIASAVQVTTPQGSRGEVVVVPGQYRSNGDSNTGVQRLVDAVSVGAQMSNSPDFQAPLITTVDGVVDTTANVVTFSADAPSPDTARVYVLYVVPEVAAGAWNKVELQKVGSGPIWATSVALADGINEVGQFYVTAVDTAGNVEVNANKGVNYEAKPLPTSQDFSISVGPQTNGSRTVAVDPGSGDYTMTLDGDSFPYTGSFPVIGEGVHLVTAVRDGGGEAAALVQIDTTAPTVTITSPTDGGRYATAPAAAFTCSDASGITSCTALDTIQTARGGPYPFRVKAVSNAGEEHVESVTYFVGQVLTVDYTGATLVSTGSASATTANVQLSARVTQLAEASQGDLTQLKARFTGVNAAGTTVFDRADVPVTLSPDGSGLATVVVSAVPVEVYDVTVTVEAASFPADPGTAQAIVTVYAPTPNQYVTGGGHLFYPDGRRGQFGMNVRYEPVGSGKNAALKLRGEAQYLFRGTDGKRYRLRSKAFDNLYTAGTTGNLTGAFAGPVTASVFDANNKESSLGTGFTWRVDVTDTATDTFAIEVRNASGAVFHRLAATAISGGSIVVHQKQ